MPVPSFRGVEDVTVSLELPQSGFIKLRNGAR